ncbi:MAG: TetR family transcriptional regulator [Blastocatellia bacterium]|nr:TetR family transcriptional regulator [Blastocatellia bacterium]
MALLTRTAAESPQRPSNGKHEAILRAAITVFARNGFFNSKVADIAREAGVADGTVYLYFKNKDDLLLSIINEALDEANERIRREMAELTDPLEKLYRIAELHLGLMGNDRDLAIVFEVEIRHSTKFMEEFSATRLSEYLRMVREIIEEGQRTGRFRTEINPQIATKVFFGAMDEMVTNWILSHKAYNLVDYARPVVDLLFRGFARE